MTNVYRRRKKINHWIIGCSLAFCYLLSACQSTRVQGYGATTDGIRSDLSELEYEQCSTAITGAEIKYEIRDVERTVNEGAQHIEKLGELLRAIRCQPIEREEGTRGNSGSSE